MTVVDLDKPTHILLRKIKGIYLTRNNNQSYSKIIKAALDDFLKKETRGDKNSRA